MTEANAREQIPGARLKAQYLKEKIKRHRNFDSKQGLTDGLVDGLTERFGAEKVLNLLDHPKTAKSNCAFVLRAAGRTSPEHALKVWGEPKIGAGARTPLVEVAESTFDRDKKTTNEWLFQLLSEDKRINKENIPWAARIGASHGTDILSSVLDLSSQAIAAGVGHKLTSGNVLGLGIKAADAGAARMVKLLRHPKVTALNAEHIVPEFADAVLNHRKTNKKNLEEISKVVGEYGLQPAMSLWGHPKTDQSNIRELTRLSDAMGLHYARLVLDHPRSGPENVVDTLTHLQSGLLEKAVNPQNFRLYLNAWYKLPNDTGLGGLLQNAREAYKMGVPADKIPVYQNEILDRGHFPNAGLIHELHKIKMKEAGRKK